MRARYYEIYIHLKLLISDTYINAEFILLCLSLIEFRKMGLMMIGSIFTDIKCGL